MTDPTVEHFVTLFDSNFLPQGMALHQSLMRWGGNFHLWVVCMDSLVEERLARLELSKLTLISLQSIETARILGVKAGRSRGEYCWTLTPFTFQAVFSRCPSAERVTYLDADVYLFDSPRVLLQELDEAGKGVLITEHAYAPEYDQSQLRGRFCVQFLTISRRLKSLEVMRWWQERCLEWCFARVEPGRFGDQKYLDAWPELFSDEVHVIRQVEKTLAPWNVCYYTSSRGSNFSTSPPVIFHYHGLRLVSSTRILLFKGYKVGRQGLRFYCEYVNALGNAARQLRRYDMEIPSIPQSSERLGAVRNLLRLMRQRIKYADLPG